MKQGIVGGSTYDGLVALTVLEHGMSLVSLVRRASELANEPVPKRL